MNDKAENIRLAKGIGMHTVWVNKDKKAGKREADYTIFEITKIKNIQLFDGPQALGRIFNFY